MGDEECAPDVASVGVLALLVEHLLVVLVVVEVDGSVESQQNHLRDLKDGGQASVNSDYFTSNYITFGIN